VTPTARLQQPSEASRDDGGEEVPPSSCRQAPLDSATLLQGGRWVEIRHNGEVYRLQATRLGKLILTK
jgi:hemin uptake protein HemP